MHLLIAVLIIPSFINVVMGLRALVINKSNTWADYDSISIFMSWFYPALIVAIAPKLIQYGYSDTRAGLTALISILLFISTSVAFIPSKSMNTRKLIKQVLNNFGVALGILIFLIIMIMNHKVHTLLPSEHLYFWLVISSFIGFTIFNIEPRNRFQTAILPDCELKQKIIQIADKCNIIFDEIYISRRKNEQIHDINLDDSDLFISADLVDILEKKELEAFIEYRLKYVAESKRCDLAGVYIYICYGIMLSLVYLTHAYIHSESIVFIIWALSFIIPFLFLYMLKKWQWYKVVKKACKLENPEYLIAALCRIANKNGIVFDNPDGLRLMPVKFTPYDFILGIAQFIGISPDELQNIIRQVTNGLDNPGNIYTLPEIIYERYKFKNKTSEHKRFRWTSRMPFAILLLLVALSANACLAYILGGTPGWLFTFSIIFILIDNDIKDWAADCK